MSEVSGAATAEVRRIVAAVLAELRAASPSPAVPTPPPTGTPTPSGGAATPPAGTGTPPASTPPRTPGLSAAGSPFAFARAGGAPSGAVAAPSVDVPDPTVPERRRALGVADPANPSGLANLAASTGARLGVGRAGPRPRTASMLLFQADHAVTQDAIFGDVPTALLEQFGLFTVQTQVTSAQEYLLRPDLGRRLSDEAKSLVAQRCTKSPNVQIVVGDGLSAAAVTNNLPQIYPVLTQGLTAAGLSLGTPFFVRYSRVGVMNDINDIVQADVVVLLIGERPGLGVADAMSVYSGWRPGAGKNDAHRDVICMITANGGTNPLEAGAFAVEHVRTVVANQASGVELRLKLSQGGGR